MLRYMVGNSGMGPGVRLDELVPEKMRWQLQARPMTPAEWQAAFDGF